MFMGAFRMNGFGQRKFLNDGSFVSSRIDQEINNWGYKSEITVTDSCSEVSCDLISPKLYEIESLPQGEVLNLFCIGDLHFKILKNHKSIWWCLIY